MNEDSTDAEILRWKRLNAAHRPLAHANAQRRRICSVSGDFVSDGEDVNVIDENSKADVGIDVELLQNLSDPRVLAVVGVAGGNRRRRVWGEKKKIFVASNLKIN